MAKVLLAVHVLAAIVAVGPVTVAASLFPRYARAALTPAGRGPASASAAALHRITRVYAVVSVVVPVFGVATAAALGVLTQAWVVVSMALTLGAGLVLALAVVPGQRRVLAVLASDPPAAPDGLRREWGRLASATGVFNVAWAVVVVLMILRPGSTTGV